MGLLANGSWAKPDPEPEPLSPSESVEVLRQRENDAWDAYGKAPWDPLMTSEKRYRVWIEAFDALKRLTVAEKEELR